MAYANKYYHKFDSVFLGDTYEFYIQGKDYGGSQSNVIGSGNPIGIEWPHTDENNKFKQVLCGSTLKVRLLTNSSATQFDEMFTTDSRKYKALFYKNSTLIWSGYGMTENYGRPYYCKPFAIELTFTDGLGLLKDIDFNENETFSWNTPQRLSKIIGLALYQTDLNLPVYESINIYETNMDSAAGDSMLYQTYIYPRAFRGLSCYETLEHILKGCRLVQSGGAWWILRIDEMKENTVYYRKWDYLADMMGGDPPSSDGTSDLSLTLTAATASPPEVFINHSQWKEWKGGWREFPYKKYYGYNGNLIKDYEDFTTSGGIDYEIDSDTLHTWGTIYDSNKYIKYSLGYINKSIYQKLKITLKGIASGRILMKLCVESDSGQVFCLSNTPNDMGYYDWNLVSSCTYSGGWFFQENYYAEEELSITFTTVNLRGLFTIPTSYEPFPGNLYLYIYEPFRPFATGIDGDLILNIDEFKVEIISETQEYEYYESTHDIINTNNIIPDTFEHYLMDGLDIANDNVMFDNIMYYYDSGYVETDKWNRRGNAENLPWSFLLYQELTWQYETEWIKLSGELISQLTMINVISDGVSRYMVASDEFSPKFDRHNVVLLQIGAEEEYILFEDEEIMELETGTYVKR